MSLSQREIARYLGYGAAPLPAEVAAYARQCEAELTAAATPEAWGGGCPVLFLPGRAGTWTITCATARRASSTP